MYTVGMEMEEGRRLVLEGEWTHTQCHQRDPTHNATSAGPKPPRLAHPMSRPVAVPPIYAIAHFHPAGLSLGAAWSTDSVGARCVQAQSVVCLPVFAVVLSVGFLPFIYCRIREHYFFEGAFSFLSVTRTEHGVGRWLQIKRHSIDDGDTRANWTTGRDPEPQRRRSKTLLPPFSF